MRFPSPWTTPGELGRWLLTWVHAPHRLVVFEFPLAEGSGCAHCRADVPGPGRYRNWNPPLLGNLPEDFLRILPQQAAHTQVSTNPEPLWYDQESWVASDQFENHSVALLGNCRTSQCSWGEQ